MPSDADCLYMYEVTPIRLRWENGAFCLELYPENVVISLPHRSFACPVYYQWSHHYNESLIKRSEYFPQSKLRP